jgi:hypothetical protein
MATTLGYAMMMGTYVARGTLRDLDALRPVLVGGEAQCAEMRQQLTLFDRRHLWVWGLIGLGVVCVLGELAVQRWTRLLGGEWSIRDASLFAVAATTWILFGRVTACIIAAVRVYSRVGERGVKVDLLDLAPLSPLTQHGLRIVLFLVIAEAASVTSVVIGPTPANSSTALALFVASTSWVLLLSAAAFLLPVRGLRRRIRTRKAEELAKIRGDIRTDQDLVAQRGSDSAEASTRLPGLITLEKRIESVREWPFDAPTLTRFFLYVAIPLGSWVGGALVERLLGAALD